MIEWLKDWWEYLGLLGCIPLLVATWGLFMILGVFFFAPKDKGSFKE